MPEPPLWETYRDVIHWRWFDREWFDERNLRQISRSAWDGALVRMLTRRQGG